MKHRLFTLVELLTVIAVIAILAGIAVPVVVGMQSKGRETSARADMNAIKIALTQFKADYSVWPQCTSTGLIASGDLLITTTFPLSPSSARTTAETAYDEITQALTNNTVVATSPTSPAASALYGNTKRKRYLDPPAKPVVSRNSTTGGYYKLDPWGRRYNIALDWNYDGKINLSSSNSFGGEESPVLGQILIYSYGTAEDDGDTEAFLCSWKTNAK